MKFSHGLANSSENILDLFMVPKHLLHNDQTLLRPERHAKIFICDLDRECNATIWPERMMALRYCKLDILRIIVLSTNDNEIFETTSDK